MLDARYTKIAMGIYLAVFENRDWDCYYHMISDKKWLNTSFYAGERWF